MPDSVAGKLAGQGLHKSAGARAALALLLAEMMLRFMAAKLVKSLRGPARIARECADTLAEAGLLRESPPGGSSHSRG